MTKPWKQRTVSQRSDWERDSPREQLLALTASMKGDVDNILDGSTSVLDLEQHLFIIQDKLNQVEEILNEFV